MGSPPTAGLLQFTVATSRDAASTATTTGFLGRQVQNAVLTIAAADRSPTATAKPVTVTFTTQTALAISDTVTFFYPDGFFLAGVATAFTQSPAAIFTSPGAVIGLNSFTVSAAAIAPIGTYTLTFTAITMGPIYGPLCGACSTSSLFAVTTSKDYMSATSNIGAIGGRVQNAGMTIATTDRVAAATAKPVTVTFTTQTALAIGDTVVISYPAGFFLAGVATAFTQSPLAIFTSPGAVIGANSFAVTAAAIAPTGTYTLTFTAITMGPPTPTSMAFFVSTTRDCASSTTATGVIGGIVTAPTLTIADVDRVATVNRRISIGFTLTTGLVSTPIADTITIQFPASFISGTPATPVTGSIQPTAAAITITNQLVLTAAAAIAAGAQTIVVCGLILSSFTDLPSTSNLIRVTTSKDYTNVCLNTPNVGTMPTAVTAVSMSIPFASRSVNTVVTPVITFTTTAAISPVTLTASGGCGLATNFISITWPAGFFVATPLIPVSGTCATLAAFQVTGAPTGYTLSAFTDGRFVLTGTTAIPAATVIALTFNGVSLSSSPTGGSDVGISVTTTADTTAATGSTGPVSGYQVTAVSLPTCRSSTTACQNFVITFNSLATVNAGDKIVITFSTDVGSGANMPLAGAPDAFMLGTALFTGGITANVLTLTSDARTGSFVPGATAITLTLTGMQIKATTLDNMGVIPVYMSAFTGGVDYPIASRQQTSVFAARMSQTGAATTTTSLRIDRPFPGVTGASATVSFTTTSGVSQNSQIFMMLPKGFFVTFSSVVNSCLVTTTGLSFTATTSTPCATLSATNIMPFTGASGVRSDMIIVTVDSGSLNAGANSFVLSGVTLSAGAVAASTTFSVLTSSDICSANAVTTGSISNSNPGGPGASSAASAVLCIALSLISLLVMML